jgi:protein-L-isoaspartate(D-aspartate) O-methyltransferase
MYENERKDLIDSLRKKGIGDENLLEAMMNVERHLFLPDAIKHHAYMDTALPIGFGQTISQPFTVAYMTQALKLQKGDKVLEIGTGSGYQAAILYEMGMKVYSIERNVDIYNKALNLFDELRIRVATRCSDGTIGWEEFAPYDGIIVTAGAPKIPMELKKQLAVDGKMVIPVGDRRTQILEIITKTDENEFKIDKAPYFAFVPLIGRDGWKEK